MSRFPGRTWAFAVALAGLAALLSLACAQAQVPAADAETMQRFTEFAGSPAYFEFLQQRLPQLEPAALRATCGDIKPVRRKRIVMLTPPAFDGDSKQPSRGAWVDQIQVSRCGTDGLRSLLIAVKESNMQLAPLLPGATDAAPALQRDALPAAEEQARQVAHCAAPMQVIDTEIDGEIKPGAPWREIWTFHGCDSVTAKVAVSFTPDGKGGMSATASPK